MGDEKVLLPRAGRKIVQSLLRFVDVAADAEQTRQPVRVTQADFIRHQAALRKTEHKSLLAGKPAFTLRVQQLEEQFATALNPRFRLAGKIIPGMVWSSARFSFK